MPKGSYKVYATGDDVIVLTNSVEIVVQAILENTTDEITGVSSLG